LRAVSIPLNCWSAGTEISRWSQGAGVSSGGLFGLASSKVIALAREDHYEIVVPRLGCVWQRDRL